jgi:hypothetical protein
MLTRNCRLNLDGVDDELDLEELWDVEEGREDDDRHDVGEDNASPRVDALALVVVLDRTPDRSVPLQRQRHRDVDGAAEDKVVHGVQAVSECVFVKLKRKKEQISNSFNCTSGSKFIKLVAIVLPKAQNISTQYTSDVTPDYLDIMSLFSLFMYVYISVVFMSFCIYCQFLLVSKACKSNSYLFSCLFISL